MLSALRTFEDGIAEARKSSALYNFLTNHVGGPYGYDDLLRAEIVYAVSAFDKLMHDVIRIGIMACYQGTRPPTGKFYAEPITIQLHNQLVNATIPPKEAILEQEIVRKLSRLSFQDPDKVSEGLSFIWAEPHKWDRIGVVMGCAPTVARTKLKLIAGRRNAIVHESDMAPITNLKQSISAPECQDVTDFILSCGQAIVHLVV